MQNYTKMKNLTVQKTLTSADRYFINPANITKKKCLQYPKLYKPSFKTEE